MMTQATSSDNIKPGNNFMPDIQPQPYPMLLLFLTSGGFAPLGLGAILAAIGIVLVIRPMRTASTILAFLSIVPAIVALPGLYFAATDFLGLPYAAKPSYIEDVAVRALSYGVCGLLGTILSVVSAVLALLRACQRVGAAEVRSPHR